MVTVQKDIAGAWRNRGEYAGLDTAQTACQQRENLREGRIVDETGQVVWTDDGVPPLARQAVCDEPGRFVGYQCK